MSDLSVIIWFFIIALVLTFIQDFKIKKVRKKERADYLFKEKQNENNIK